MTSTSLVPQYTSDFSRLRQFAFDVLSIPATSAELERVFSQAKRLYTDDRNRLGTDAFEAAMCLRHWSRQGLYSVLTATAAGTTSDSSEIVSDQWDAFT